MLLLMSKSKLTPIRSKKLSLSVMKRTSMVTWRSCSRRNCSSRSSISSCTSCVWLTTMLRFVSKGAIEPGPPTASQVVGLTVEVIRSIRLSKSACAPPPSPPGPCRSAGSSDRRPVRRADRPDIWANMFGLSMALLPLPSRLATTAIGVVVDEPNGMRRRRTRPTLAMASWYAPGQAHRRGHEVRNRHHQVGHVVGHRVHLPVAHLLAGDLQHLVLDHVAQVQRLEDQVQRALEHDLVAQLDGDRRIAGHAFFGQSLRVEVQVDLGQFGQVFQHLAQRGIGELQRDRRAELLLDLDFALRCVAACGRPANFCAALASACPNPWRRGTPAGSCRRQTESLP